MSLDCNRMARILEIDERALDARVQPGVTKDGLNAALRERGLFFAVDPGADATIGGMAASGASGTMTVRYGTIRENVLAIEAVLADGTVIRTGSRARKSSAGYDLMHLLCGSEGTLAVITELVVRVHGIPEHVAAARVSFPTVRAAADTAIAIVQSGIPIARCELLDGPQMDAVNKLLGPGRAGRARRCSSSSTGRRQGCASRSRTSRRSRPSSAAAPSAGPCRSRSAPASGRRGTTSTSRCSPTGRAAAR